MNRMNPALSIFLISLLAFPMTYFVNTAQSVNGETGLFVAGFICLSTVCLLTYLAVAGRGDPGGKGEDENYWSRGKGSRGVDWLFYVFTLGIFASVVDLIIGLETDGLLKGFMTVYLRSGEPYLGTPYGALITYWDGTAHYAMYLYMLTAMSFRSTFRKVGLYWAGSIGHSMLVLIPGAVLGVYGVRWSFLLNVPYIFIPFISAARFLSERATEKKTKQSNLQIQSDHQIVSDSTSIWRRPFDVVLVLSLLVAISLCLFRGFAVLGCRHKTTMSYLDFYEPYLKDPVAFPKVQMLIYLFYFVPLFVAATYALLRRGCDWMPDWAIIFAGASAQAQFSHILGSIHYRTAPQFHVPGHESARVVFWTVNLFLLALPHLLALRCWMSSEHFLEQPALPETQRQELRSTVSAKRKTN